MALRSLKVSLVASAWCGVGAPHGGAVWRALPCSAVTPVVHTLARVPTHSRKEPNQTLTLALALTLTLALALALALALTLTLTPNPHPNPNP